MGKCLRHTAARNLPRKTLTTSRRGAMEVAAAKMAASTLFRLVGVKLEWHTGRRSCKEQRDRAIMVSLPMNTP